jgi:hypothetical protein
VTTLPTVTLTELTGHVVDEPPEPVPDPELDEDEAEEDELLPATTGFRPNARP